MWWLRRLVLPWDAHRGTGIVPRCGPHAYRYEELARAAAQTFEVDSESARVIKREARRLPGARKNCTPWAWGFAVTLEDADGGRYRASGVWDSAFNWDKMWPDWRYWLGDQLLTRVGEIQCQELPSNGLSRNVLHVAWERLERSPH